MVGHPILYLCIAHHRASEPSPHVYGAPGAIEASELKEVLKECDYEVDDAKLAETLKHYDLDNNQSLCLKEFEMLLRDFMY